MTTNSKNIYKPEIVKLMREDLRPFLEAGNSCCLIEDDELSLKELQEDVKTVYIGLEKDIKTSLYPLCDRILSLVKLKFRSLKVKEFTLLCANGLMGDYGPVKQININMFGTWIKDFCVSQKRMEAFREYFSLEGQFGQEVKLSKSEGDAIIMEGILKNFTAYKDSKDKVLTLPPKLIGIYYDLLNEKGILRLSLQEQDKISKEAKDLLPKLKNAEPDLLTGIFGKMETEKTLRRRIAVKQYFDSLIAEKKELKDLIK